jgi:DNA replication protein DnaC
MTAQVQEQTAVCPSCQGRGVVFDSEVAVGRHGTLKLCTCVQELCRCGGQSPFQYWDEESRRQYCHCAARRRQLSRLGRLFSAADLPSRFRWKFRADFTWSAPGGGSGLRVARNVRPVLDYLGAVLEDGGEPRRGYLLHGPPGTGKTLLACVILNELILHRGRPGRFLNLSRKYFQQLRDTYSAGSDQYGRTWQIMQELCEMPYLILDDFGVQRGTDWETEMLYDLVDARYADERLTVVTTNKPVAEIKQLSQGRIHSRLIEMCYIVDMEGDDYRMFTQSG